jgi:AraC-like DNA-binding protein
MDLQIGAIETLSAAAEFTAGLQSLFLCLLLLRRPDIRTPANLALAAAALVFAACMADSFLTTVHAYDALPPGVICIGNVPPSLIGPLIYLHVEAQIAGKDWRFTRRHWRHGICFLILLLFLLLALAFPAPREMPPGKPSAALLASIAFLVLSSLGAYLIIAGQSSLYLYRSIRLTRQHPVAAGDAVRLSWLRLLLLVLTGLWLLYLIDDGVLVLVGLFPVAHAAFAVGYALTLYGMAWISLHHGAAFQQPPGPLLDKLIAPFAKYRRSAQTTDAAARLVAKIEAAIVKDRLYRESALSLPALASRVGSRANAVSQAINQHAGLKFFDFINRFRIEEARTLLADPDNREKSVLAIAYAVGFNSKSTFNAAFKKFSGVTPTEFRKGTRPSR